MIGSGRTAQDAIIPVPGEVTELRPRSVALMSLLPADTPGTDS